MTTKTTSVIQTGTTLVFVAPWECSRAVAQLPRTPDDSLVVCFIESVDKGASMPWHRQKLVLILSAMRHFADALIAAGYRVDYRRAPGYAVGIAAAALEHHSTRVVATEGREQEMVDALDRAAALLDNVGITLELLPDRGFLATREEFTRWAGKKKELRMEFFYREMRRATGLLMDGRDPVGGQWNYDKDNRKPAGRDLLMPKLPHFAPDTITRDVLELVTARFVGHVGSLDDFGIAVTRADALATQAHFLAHVLPRFGDFQDAMLSGEPYLYHAHLSFYINCGLLDPLALCHAVEAEYRAGNAPLNAAEGFIRQIIGWREYVRGIYWWTGPEYGTRNYFNAKRPLPAFYWTNETDMHCMSQAIGQTLDLAYAHHIQRLMVTGNYALLIGADPDDVDRWYLEVYADAYEWVEQPNTRGMILFADGGMLGSKPYAASGAYINRMSDYCGKCRYDVKQRIGPDACPFNALYWDFLARNRDKLGNNNRLGPVYRNWDRMASETQAALRGAAADTLARLDAAPKGY